MKIKINLKFKTGADQASALNLTVGAGDTVSSVKDRIATSQAIPFPHQDLMLGGEILADSQKIMDCDVNEGSCLDFVVKASEADVVQQLTQLLKARDLSADELGLLYCYKHGASMNQTLKMVGYDGKLPEFVKSHKAFLLEAGRVSLVREDTTLKPFSLIDEIVQILKASGGSMEIKELCSKFALKFNVSLASIAGTRPTEFLAKEEELFRVNTNGRAFVSLKSFGVDAAAAKAEVPPCDHGKPGVASVPQHVDAPPGLGSSVPPAASAARDVRAENATAEGTESDSQPYIDLHTRICSRAFNSKTAQSLGEIVDAISECAFFDVKHVVKGGSVGKGTAISSGITDAEVVFFLKGLPNVGHDRWLPPLLRAAAGVLSERLGDDHGVESIRTTEDSVQVCVKGSVLVDIRFSSVFDTFAHTVLVLGQQGPENRKFYFASLAKERAQFVSRQPSQVKITMRLMKWWRDQQDWSGKLVRPSDEVIELVVVYSAVQTKPSDQRTAIANVMSLLSRFDELRIVWSNFYTKADVWSPLLRQRPLLMDPTNPFVNVADPQAFDPREVMDLAKTTHFFW